jgi:hypothetical protein
MDGEIQEISSNDIELLEEPFPQEPSPEEIIRANIQKANDFLDRVLAGNSGDYSPRIIETTSRLIDSITNAADKLITASNDFLGLELKRDIIALKEKEILLSKTREGISQGDTNITNVIITTREEILKTIKEQKQLEE